LPKPSYKDLTTSLLAGRCQEGATEQGEDPKGGRGPWEIPSRGQSTGLEAGHHGLLPVLCLQHEADLWRQLGLLHPADPEEVGIFKGVCGRWVPNPLGFHPLGSARSP